MELVQSPKDSERFSNHEGSYEHPLNGAAQTNIHNRTYANEAQTSFTQHFTSDEC